MALKQANLRIMKVLLLGAGGQLGKSIQSNFSESVDLINLSKKKLSITNKKALGKAIKLYHPDFVINAAAYTNVDGAETERNKANKVNNLSLHFLVELSNSYNFTLIHFSTDYVFDGKTKHPYLESNEMKPINYYGLSKSLGDKHIIENCNRYYLFRVSWLYSPFGKNFVTTMIGLSTRDSIEIIDDQYGRPTSAVHLSKFLSKLVSGSYQLEFGVYNFSSSGSIVSWSGFAEEIFTNAFKSKLIDAIPKIKNISSKGHNGAALRPSYSVLSNEKIEKTCKISFPNWRELLIYDLKLIG